MKKNIKITFSAFLSLCLIILSSCSASEKQVPLYDRGIEVVSLLHEMAHSETYIEAYSGNTKIKDIITSVGSDNPALPKAVYEIKIPTDKINELLNLGEANNFSDRLNNFIKSRSYSIIPTQINAIGGAEKLAAASICTIGTSFIDKNLSENVMYLYVYENSAPVIVNFSPAGNDNIVNTSGMFIFNENFSTDIFESLKEFFTEMSVEITEVKK